MKKSKEDYHLINLCNIIYKLIILKKKFNNKINVLYI